MSILIKNKRNILVVILSIVYSSLIIYTSLLFSRCIEELMQENIQAFLSYTALSIALWVIATLVSVFQIYIQTAIIQDFIYSLRYNATAEFVKYDNLLANNKSENYLNMSLYDTEQITKHSNNLYNILNSIVMTIVSGVTLVNIHYSLLIFVLIAVALMSIAPRLFEGRIKERTQNISASMGSFKKELDNLVQGRITLSNFNAFNWLFKSVKEQSANLKQAHLQNTLTVRSLQGIVVILNIMSQLGVVGLAGYLAYLDLIPFPIIFSVGQVAGQTLGSITGVINGIPEYYALTSLLEKFPSPPQKIERVTTSEGMTLEDSIKLDQVGISFDGKTIEFPNIKFLAGQKYALTGPSGSGKSTLLKILNGDIRSYSGDILWDQKSYQDISTAALKRSVVTMSQNTHLFNQSIKDNIILEREYDESLMQEIIKKTHLNTLLDQLDQGLDTVIDADNITLSGGQVQRIALARCLYHQPRILLIDEGTANIDVKTAVDIETILLTTTDLTVIMVSHHISDEIRPLIDYTVEL